MEVYEDIHSGWPKNLELVRRISAYTRNDQVRRFKIGISGDCNQRAFQPDYVNSYDEMIVLWRTDSVQRARITEGELVGLYKTKCARCFNLREGGAGPVKGPPCFLYVVRKWT